MKKGKLIRNVSLVALSAVMVCGTAVAFTGCKKGSAFNELRVKIFCDATDAATNEQICKNWAKDYTDTLHKRGLMDEDVEIKITFDYDPSSENYFTQLDKDFSSSQKTVADIIYMSPKYTRVWQKKGRVLEISQYLQTKDQEEYARNVANINRVWQNAISFYGYSDEGYSASPRTYNLGDPLHYDMNGAKGAGFYNDNNVKVGLYAMPKDYSNFSMGFNAKYFTDALKEKYQTRKATDVRDVKGSPATGSKTKDLNYKGGDDGAGIITYATDGDGWSAGDDAPIISIGVPVRYKPFNFYAYESFDKALAARDPVALMVAEYTEDVVNDDGIGDGYVVTIPGFPGDTFEIDGNTSTDAEAVYDSSIGHVVYTYAEFGALSWAITYYCNTFDWTALSAPNAIADADLWGKDGDGGTGGMTLVNGNAENVFANDQYEGLPNSTLYLLPWLAGNDADFINSLSDAAVQPETEVPLSIDSMTASTRGGKASESIAKKSLDGNGRTANVQYGVNSENFIETYGAFLAYGSDWNGNSGNSGVMSTVKPDNGWSLFRDGACIFYGAGTWDSKTKNESSFDKCEYRQMPMPVGEKYALCSYVKDGYYQMRTYAWNGGTDSVNTTTNPEQALAGVLSSNLIQNGKFTDAALKANLTNRQDKWAARMDSVGYAINKYVEEAAKKKGAEWKLEGAAALVMALTANADDQRNLVYGGAQLPNFKYQCVELLQYQNTNYTGKGLEAGADKNLSEHGTFVDMVTPEGYATTQYYVRDAQGKLTFNNGQIVKNTGEHGVNEAKEVWAAYTAAATAMSKAGFEDNSSKTVKAFLDEWNQGKPIQVKCDPQYEGAVLNQMTGETSYIAAAMKYLRMTTYTYADRDLNVRMQYGLNAVRDSAMYTYTNGWIDTIAMRTGNGIAYAYINQKPLAEGTTIKGSTATDPSTKASVKLQTPAFYCLRVASMVNEELKESINTERRQLR